MGRLIAFLATGALVGFLGGLFQVPNMIPLTLIILWLGMGAGLKFGYALVGSLLMPLVVAGPMSVFPPFAPANVMVPPDDSRMIEMFYVPGAPEAWEEALAQHDERRPEIEQRMRAGLLPQDAEPRRPTLRAANLAVADSWNTAEADYRVWPLKRAFLLSVVLTMGAWVVNTVTQKPFREPGPLGAE